MNKEETAKFIKSIMKEVNKLTELTKQLQRNIDNAPILKEKDNIYRKIKTNLPINNKEKVNATNDTGSNMD